jgi:transcriptional regulator with XRE-family HTH domain
MNIGDRITQLRKEKALSQTDLATAISASREAISKYERNEASPSVEVASKIAEVFGVTIDYLIGKNHNMAVDKKTLKRMEDIDKLDNDTQEKLFFLIDNVIQNSKAKKAFAS